MSGSPAGAGRGSPPRVSPGALLVALLMLPALVASAASPRFDSQRNPFAYAGEYRDPSWGGTYLRARWYQPQLPTFVSRDPMLHEVNHYGYGGGNALMHVDPSGMSYRSGASGLGHFLAGLNSGTGGHFARVFLSLLTAPLQIFAAPGAFWHSLSHDTGGVTAFLALGILAEGAYYQQLLSPTRFLAARSGTMLFRARALAESVLGGGYAAASSFGGHFHHFHAGVLLQGLEMTFGPEIAYRMLAGLGYQPFRLTHEDLQTLVRRELSRGSGKGLVFRSRFDDLTGGRLRLPDTWTSPLMDRMDWSHFHTELWAIFEDDQGVLQVVSTENNEGVEVKQRPYARFDLSDDPRYPHRFRFEYVGKFDAERVKTAAYSNPANLPTEADVRNRFVGSPFRNRYRTAWRNCQTHVRLIIDDLLSGG